MKRVISIILVSVTLVLATALTASAATTHTVKKGDSLWRIAVTYKVGLSEIKAANPTIKNYNLIYPGQIINIPSVSSSVASFESEVVRLVNAERSKVGLAPLTQDWQLSRVARYKSQDMKDNNYFSHTSPVYGSPFNMMKKFGISEEIFKNIPMKMEVFYEKFDKECMNIPIFKYYDPYQTFQRISCASNEDIVLISYDLVKISSAEYDLNKEYIYLGTKDIDTNNINVTNGSVNVIIPISPNERYGI